MIPEGIEATPLVFFARALKHPHVRMYTGSHTHTHTHAQAFFSVLIKTVFSSVEACQASTVGIPAES